MDSMANNEYLHRRKNVWYYFRRVPKGLEQAYKTKFIKRSLNTSDVVKARAQRNIINLEIDAMLSKLADAGNLNGRIEELPLASAPSELIIEYVRMYVERATKAAEQSLIGHPPKNAEERAEIKENIEETISSLKSNNPQAEVWIDQSCNKLFREHQIKPETQIDSNIIFDAVKRALIEVEHRKIDVLNNEHGISFHDKLFSPSKDKMIQFSTVANQFWKEKREEFVVNEVSQKRIDKVMAEIDFVVEAIGPNVLVSSISDDDIQRVRGILSKLPANRKKIFPNASLEESVKLAAKHGSATLSPTTQSRYLDCLREVMKFAQRKGYVHTSPAENIKPIKKQSLAPEEKRLPFSKEQLIGFFNGKFYKSCVPNSSEVYTKKDRDWRFWLPLIMLFSGMRPNEICQLTVGDIKKTQSGVSFFDLSNYKADGKTVKTSSSARRVPIHPELIKLGLIAFVDERRMTSNSSDAWIFENLKPDKYGNRAHYATKRFNEYFIKQEIALEQRQSLYSLRHNVRDALRIINAPDSTLLAVTGWSQNGKSASDYYGDPKNPDLHYAWVAKISYKDLDLSYLHIAK